MKNEISLSMLWKVFTKAWVTILVLVIVAMLVTGLVTNYLMVKKYSSSVTFYVINVSPDNDYVTTSLMQVIEHLSNDYIQIIKSEVMMVPLCDFLMSEYGIEYTPNEIRQMIDTTITSDSSTFSLKVTNSDINHAYIIAQYIAYEAPEVIKEYTSFTSSVAPDDDAATQTMEKMRVLNNPKPDTEPDSPSLIVNLGISAMATAVLIYAIYLLKFMFNTIISTEEDIKRITNKYPIIGTIPRWE